MAQRLTVTGDAAAWTAEVDTEQVRLRPVDPADANSAREHTTTVRDAGDGHFAIGDPSASAIGIAAMSGDRVWVSIRGRLFDFEVVSARGARSGARDQDALVPPMSGTVVRVAVKPGDHVKRGDTLVVLEAMKMELPIRAPRDGIVSAVHCSEGQLAQPGQPVVELAK